MPEQPVGAALPFAGVSVLDLAAPVSAYCGRVLAGYGADVVRVERPAPASSRRRRPPGGVARRVVRGRLPPRHARRRRRPGGAAARRAGGDRRRRRRLADGGDAGRRLRRRPARARVVRPSVVTCLLTPFGATGPLRDWRATPLTAHAMSGLMYPVGPEDGPPLSMPGRQLWDEAGIRAATCIAAALHERPWVGGQVLDIAAHEVAASQDDVIHRFSVAGLVMQRRANFGVPPSGTWQVADGMIDIAVNTPGHWEAFVKTMGSPPELTDEMWQDRTMRTQLHDVLGEIVAAAAARPPPRRARRRGQAQRHAVLGAQHARAVRRRPAAPTSATRSARCTHPTLGTRDVPARRSTSAAPFHRARPRRAARRRAHRPPCSSTSSATAPTSSRAGGRSALSELGAAARPPARRAARADVRRVRRRQHGRADPRRARHGRRQDRVARCGPRRCATRTSSITPTCASRRGCRRRRSTAASPAACAAWPSSSAGPAAPRSSAGWRRRPTSSSRTSGPTCSTASAAGSTTCRRSTRGCRCCRSRATAAPGRRSGYAAYASNISNHVGLERGVGPHPRLPLRLRRRLPRRARRARRAAPDGRRPGAASTSTSPRSRPAPA